MFHLRDYQVEVIEAIQREWDAGHNSVMAVLATGLGKTEVFVRIADQWEHDRVLVIAPTIELVKQAVKKFKQRTGIAPGIEQGGKRSNEIPWCRSQFVVASKQTLSSKNGSGRRCERIREVGLVIVDECHLAATQQYAQLLDHYKSQGARVLGVTATPKRHDKKAMAMLFDTCAYNMGIDRAVESAWLVRPIAHCLQLDSLDLTNVRTNGKDGDFREGDLARVMEDDRVIHEIASITAKESEGLKTVVYCATVAEARSVSDLLCDTYGRKSAWICGDRSLCSEGGPEQDPQELHDRTRRDPDRVQRRCAHHRLGLPRLGAHRDGPTDEVTQPVHTNHGPRHPPARRCR